MLDLSVLTRLVDQWSWDQPVPVYSVHGLGSAPGLYMGDGDSNSAPHAYTGCHLTPRKAFQSTHFFPPQLSPALPYRFLFIFSGSLFPNVS